MTKVTFYIDDDYTAYGDGADENAPNEYAEFAKTFFEKQGFEVEIVFYTGHLPDTLTPPQKIEQYGLNDQVWDAFCETD